MAKDTHILRPRVACEITAERVAAARINEGGNNLEAATASTLPPGLVAPGLQEANILERDKLVAALRDLLTAVAGRLRDVCLVLPDSTTRVMLLDFDTLPDKREDADAVVRFRLKKSLPFDVEHSVVSFDRQGGGNQIRVIAAVTPRNILEEYESLVRDAGYNPGTVLPSMLASLGLVDASRPTMVIKVEYGTTTFAIVDQGQLLLYRSLDNGGSAVTGESLVDDVNTSLVYFEDRYGVNVERVLVTGVQNRSAVAGSVRRQQRSRGRADFECGGRHGGRQRQPIRVGGSCGGPGFVMRLAINLATQPYEVAREFSRRMTIIIAALGILAVLLVGYIVYLRAHTRGINRQIAGVEQQIDGLDREETQARAILNKPANRVIADQSDFLNDLFARKSLSWTRIFSEMEKIVPAELHVVSMKPEYTKTNDLVLHVVVATDSRDRAVELMRHMEKSNHFRQVQIVAETVVANTSAQSSGQGAGIQFDIAGVYVPTGADTDENAEATGAKGQEQAQPAAPVNKAAVPTRGAVPQCRPTCARRISR